MNSFLDKLLQSLRFGKVIRHIPDKAIVCDIGCGPYAYFLKKISGSIKKGIGLDKKIKNYQDPKIELRKIEVFKNLPMEKETFTVVTMIAVLEHFERPQEVLNECFRILKKEGKLILTTPSPVAKPILEVLANLRLIDKNEIQDHKNYFWPKEIEKMLLESGFEEENIENYFFEFYLNNLIIVKK